MAGRVEVDPEGLQRVANQIGHLGDQLRALAARAEDALAPGSAAWGDDRFGAKFAMASGDSAGFAAGADSTALSTGNLGATLESVSDGQVQAAGALRNNEQASADSF
ncbi:hypothetical protein [Nocardia sp. NPDC057353]|uniref:hypothetical protein n=1 Tax=Nocardia sp. NPDC057353 TaxID=3346104 RepID=UPI0036297B60